ncbi:hypothetical protein COLO4_17237 [Corchorus olitorius]|uniref:Uncharacterized protein n=1 Tax=Corchorus olitorius TaxID=93759 RepID=A0A1R3JDL6_9ROSI|nr:hypothetical protein COLO4_17237 [Corchorus olitorius]
MAEDVAERYLNELVERYMVLVGKRDASLKIKTCRMHDLVRDLCLSKAKQENFTCIGVNVNNIISSSAVGVTALSALSLACYNRFFSNTQSSKKASGSSSSALPHQKNGTVVEIQTGNSQILENGDLQRETFAKETNNLAEKLRENTEAHENKEVVFQFQETTVANEDLLLTKTSESSGADCLVFTADSPDASEESGISDIPFQPTVLLESGPLQPLMFATEMSELHIEEVESINEFEAGLPRIAVVPMSTASSVLEKDDHVLVEESEVTRHYNIFKESVREELHTFYDADQAVENSLTNLNGLKPVSSHVSFSTLKQNSERNRAQLSSKTSLQTADMVEGKVAQACSNRGSTHKRKDFGRGGQFQRDKENKHLIQKDTKLPPYSFPNGMPANDNHHPEEHFSSYNRLLRDGRLSDCVTLLEDMEQKGLLDMNKVYHAKFFKICNKKKAVQEAFRFTKLIPNPTLSTFNMLMSVCASSQDSEGAFEVLRLVQEAGFKADCKLYTTLISTCAKSGKVDTMFEVFHEMVNCGVEPNVNTYGALIDGCARAGQVAKAFGAYGIMRSKNVKPDRVVFNALITACGQSGAVDRAFDVLAEMMAETQPIEPDHITVGALIKACSNAGQVDRAREVYKMIDKFNISGTPEVYTIAVNCCSQNGDWEFACRVYEDMKRKSVAPDEVFISALIDVAGHAGNLDAAFEILDAAKNQGINIGIVSYSSLMGACSNAKNWQKALELYENIKALNLNLTVSTVNAVITSLCEADQLPKAMEVLSEMKELGLCPSTITYSILLMASERKNDFEVGLMLLSQARKDGVAPNIVMARCIIGMCLRRFKKSCMVGEPVLSFNLGRPHIENKWTSVALAVYRDTIVAGTVPTMEVVSQILGCLRIPLDDSLKSRLVENLEVSADSSRYSSLSSLIDGFGEYDPRAFSLLEEAASFGIVPCVSFKESPIVIDARELPINIAEVYLLTILKGLKHRLAAGAKLPSISIVLPLVKAQISNPEKEKSINLAGRLGRAIAALLRRIGLPYQGNESYGKIRINGLALNRWFQPKLASPFTGKPGEWNVSQMRLGKGIFHQQRNIRTDLHTPNLD